MDTDRFPVRPTVARLRAYCALVAFHLFVGCLGLLLAVLTGDLPYLPLGAVFLFGAVYLVLPLVNAWRHHGSFTVLVLTTRGMETEGGVVPWEDVLRVGAATYSPRSTWPQFFGVTLRDHSRFLDSIESQSPRRAASVHRQMRRSQRQNGWDLVVSPLLLDRPLPEFIALVKDFRVRGLRGDDPDTRGAEPT